MQTQEDYSIDEIGDRAEDYYERHLRASLDTDENLGKLLMIDLRTDRYVIGTSQLAMARELDATAPKLVYTLKIGYPAVTSLGGDLRPYRDMTAEETASLKRRIRRSDQKA